MKKLTILLCLRAAFLAATDFPVTDAFELNTAIISANSSGTADRILFNGNTIDLGDLGIIVRVLRPIHITDDFIPLPQELMIEGPGALTNSIGSSELHRGLFIAGRENIPNMTTINDITFTTIEVFGGPGGAVQIAVGSGNEAGSGGGAPGMGAALFISPGSTVVLHNCSFDNCIAEGGAGGVFADPGIPGATGGGGGGGFGIGATGGLGGFVSGGGGGGFGFPGGFSLAMDSGAGGGGGAGEAGTGGAVSDGGDGGGDFTLAGGGTGGVAAVPPGNGGDGASGAGGGGGAFEAATRGGDGGIGGMGGGGGGGGGTGGGVMEVGGSNGGFGNLYGGGGGGGAFNSTQSPDPSGGDCSFGGGAGGGAVLLTTDPGLCGGFGGSAALGAMGSGSGGGGSTNSPSGLSAPGGQTKGFGGAFGEPGLANTLGSNGGRGGGGGGFGGAIFLHQDGTLIITGTFSLFNNRAFGGSGGIDSAQGLGQDLFMMSGSQLTFNLDQDFTMPNPIEGNEGRIRAGLNPETVPTNTGGLTKQGVFALTLVGNNTYTGMTTVEGGRLTIDGSVASDITVESAGTLTGTFEVRRDVSGANGGNIINQGFFSPGFDDTVVGAVDLDETFTNDPTGTLRVTITPAPNVCDKVRPAGNSTINGGQLEVFISAGTYIVGSQYEVITGTVAGTFDNQASPTQVGPGAGTVFLGVESGSLIITILRGPLFPNQIIDPGIPSQVAACIAAQTIVPGTDFSFVVDQLETLSSPELNQALFSLSAVRFGSLEWINARNNSYVADLLSQHLIELCCSPRDCCDCVCNRSIWITGYGNIMDNTKRYNNLPRFDATTSGLLTGIDWCFCDAFYLGAAFGYSRTDLDLKKHAGSGDSNNFLGALYGSWLCNCFVVEAAALGGGSDYDIKRKLKFASIDRTAHSDFWGYFFTGRLGLRGTWDWCCSRIEPFALVDYHYYTHEKFTEKGAKSIDLTVKDKTQHMLRGEAGLLWGYEYNCECYCFFPYLGLSWVGEYPLHKSKQPASFIWTSCVIDALSFKSEQNLAAPQAGVKFTYCNGFSFLVGYKGLFNNRTRINQIDGRVEWIF